MGHQPCVSACTYIPDVESEVMVCAIRDGVDLPNVKPGLAFHGGDLAKLYTMSVFVDATPPILMFWIRFSEDASCDSSLSLSLFPLLRRMRFEWTRMHA